MRWLFSFLLLALLSLVQALSSSGARLLVVIEEAAEKEKYSQFLGDLEGAPGTTAVNIVTNDTNALVLQGEASSSRTSHLKMRSSHCSNMASEHTTT